MFLRIVLIGLFLIGFGVQDLMAAVPFLSPGQSLDAQAERFRQEYSMEKRARDEKIKKVLIEFQDNEKALVAQGPTFILKKVNITGATVFDPAHLEFIWKPYVGKRVDFKSVNDIVEMVKRVYKDLGLLTTTAYLPPQDIQGGVLEVRVVEGRRANLVIEGNKWFSTPSIAKYFHTYRGEVLDMGEMERDVMRLNQNKDLNISSVLSPGQDPQTVDVILKAQENPPYHVSVGTDNQGNRLTGMYRRLVNMSATNLTGNEDTLAFNGAYTDLSHGEYLSYQTPVGTNGVKVGMDAGYFDGKLGAEYKPFDITNYTEFYDPNASFELYQSDNAQANLRSGMKIEHIIKREGRAIVTEEDLRLPYLALDMIKTDAFGQTTFSPELSFSTQGLLDGSTAKNEHPSRPEADRFFTKYDQYISRNQAMPWSSYLQIRSQFQTSSHTLPSSEELQLGGDNSVRGYPEGDYLADIGGYVQTEWYFPSYFIPPSWRLDGASLRNAIEPFVFYDMGGGELTRVNSGERKKQFLSGTGAGIKVHIKNNMYIKLEWGVATGDKPIHGSGPSTVDVSFQAGT